MSASSSTQPLGQRLAALDGRRTRPPCSSLLDDLGGRARADVGHDQRLLEALPGLLVERALEQRRLDLGAERLRASCTGSRAGGGRSPRRCSGSALAGDRRARPPSPVMKRSVQSRAIAVRDDSAAWLDASEPLPADAAAGRRPRSPRWSPRWRRSTGRIDVPGHAERDAGGLRPAARGVPRRFDDGRRAGVRAAASSASTTARRDQAHVRRAAPRAAAGSRGCCSPRSRTRRASSATAVRLDTGPAQPHAQALYESAGYRADRQLQREPGRGFWGEKRLAALGGRDRLGHAP